MFVCQLLNMCLPALGCLSTTFGCLSVSFWIPVYQLLHACLPTFGCLSTSFGFLFGDFWLSVWQLLNVCLLTFGYLSASFYICLPAFFICLPAFISVCQFFFDFWPLVSRSQSVRFGYLSTIFCLSALVCMSTFIKRVEESVVKRDFGEFKKKNNNRSGSSVIKLYLIRQRVWDSFYHTSNLKPRQCVISKRKSVFHGNDSSSVPPLF